MSPPGLSTPFNRPLTWLLALAVAFAILWLDRSSMAAGPVVLLLLSGTVGVFHGALDGSILLRQFRPVSRAVRWGLAYLITVVLLGIGLLPHPEFSLLLLLVLSVWHFGEIYDRTVPESRWASLAVRLIAGGAPVMVPILTSVEQLNALSQAWTSPHQPWLAQVWTGMAWVWMAFVAGYVICSALVRLPLPRWLMGELTLVLALNLFLTPAMAFGLYFGLYHALSHVWRVLRTVTALDKAALRTATAILALTFGLAAGLLGLMASSLQGTLAEAPVTYLPMLVHWLIVGLAALTVPHLILISYSAQMLAGKVTSQSHRDPLD